MKIWLLKDNKKSGPHESYMVRERVSQGELSGDEMAWYDGAPEWIPLKEVPSMEIAFPKVREIDIATAEPIDDSVAESAAESQSNEVRGEIKLFAMQRFIARFFDIIIYMVLVQIVRVTQGFNPFEDALTPSAQFFYHVPYVLIDALLMHLWGTTPGKKLFGVSIMTDTGERLKLGESLLRSARVWVLGFGMFTILMPLSLIFSWFVSRRFGRYLWDIPKNYHVHAQKFSGRSILLAALIYMMVSSILYHLIPESQRPNESELKARLEKMLGGGDD